MVVHQIVEDDGVESIISFFPGCIPRHVFDFLERVSDFEFCPSEIKRVLGRIQYEVYNPRIIFSLIVVHAYC